MFMCYSIKQLFKAPCSLQYFCIVLGSSREIHQEAFCTRSITDCKNFPGLHLKTSHRTIPMERSDWLDRSPLPILCHGAEMRLAPSFAITSTQRWDLSCSAWQSTISCCLHLDKLYIRLTAFKGSSLVCGCHSCPQHNCNYFPRMFQ